MLFSLYNHPQRLWRGADGTSISTMNLNLHVDVRGRREASIKWGVGGNLEGDHYRLRRTRKKLLGLCRGPTFFDEFSSVHFCLIVMNTILTVIRALKPSSLTHSPQIYCTGLVGPRSYTSWAWVTKRASTIGAVYGKSLCVSECDG